jgi:xanthine/CO dehydrogenase XdhC/CoxF family maturation factor
MTHEFKNILQSYKLAKQLEQKTVLATVVAVDGSSYRGAGVRMLILENEAIVGAISGGCVEKEVVRQAQSVFQTGSAKMMTYDGRFRLGCEGTLYVLLEVFSLEESEIESIERAITEREEFVIKSHYNLEGNKFQKGSFLQLNGDDVISFSGKESVSSLESKYIAFSEKMIPCFRLVIIGTEHDAASLCLQASNLGWEVIIVASPDSRKQISDFTGASELLKRASDNFTISKVDHQTAFVLMNHNYAKDLLYLKALKITTPIYIGLLGPSKRKEQMLSAFIEYHFEVEEDFLDVIYGPAGLDIGGETPQEIAISIISEIIAVTQRKKAYHLQDKIGSIHERANKTLACKNDK